MRVGVVPTLDRSWGGVYQYSSTLLHALAELNSDDEFIVFAPKGLELAAGIRALPFQIVEMPSGSLGFGAVWGRIPAPVQERLAWLVALMRKRRAANRSVRAESDSTWKDWFARFDLDLLLFTIEDERAPRAGVPYVVVIHDLQHKLQPDLPEFEDKVEWQRREDRVAGSVSHAMLVLVDSETGREDVVTCYRDTGVRNEDVWPLPFVPAHYVDADVSDEMRRQVRETYGLPESFVFYPAQFWPHKNHVRIVEALGILAQQGLRIPIVLVGSNSGTALRAETFAMMMTVARERGVEDLVRYLGYVPDSDMSALYSMATALIMPTFFGPTNIPVVEAWGLGCPVLTSNIRGIREQAGDAAVLVDPSSADSIATGIRSITSDDLLRQRLIEHGHARLDAYTTEDFVRRLGEILEEAGRRLALS